MSMRIRTGFCAGAAMLIATFHTAAARPPLPAPELHLATSYRGVSDVHLFAAAWQVKAPSWTRASRMEIAAGLVDGAGRARLFTSVGPVWRLNRSETPVFVEFGFSPTVLGGSTLGSHDLGGNLHFTSSLTLGRDFDQGPLARIAVRIQHLSNGGLHDSNPGLDLVALNFVSRSDPP